jgi:hypothetical protein
LVANQPPVFHFYQSTNSDLGSKIYLEDRALNTSSVTLDSLVKLHKTIAFLIIRNDTILFEKYLEGYTDSSNVASF